MTLIADPLPELLMVPPSGSRASSATLLRKIDEATCVEINQCVGCKILH